MVPAISVTGVLLISFETTERRPLDWRILGGGLALGVVILILALGSVPFSQELIFVLSMVVVCAMLVVVTRDIDADTRRSILYASVVIFVFRASPTVGDGYFWWTLDVLKFDGAFYGTLRQTAAILSIVAIWLLSKQVTEYPVAKVLFWIVIASTILSLPNISLFYGLHHWTEAKFGFGTRAIAIIDAATASPSAQLSIIPLLTLIAFYAPAGHRATWFALMASLMNLALVAGQLQTKYLNQIFIVGRGDYAELGPLLIAVAVIGLVVPLAIILLLGGQIDVVRADSKSCSWLTDLWHILDASQANRARQPDDRRFRVGRFHRELSDRGGCQRGRPRAQHLGHVLPSERPRRQRRYRRRRLRSLPSLRAGHRADARSRGARLSLLDRLAARSPVRPRRGK
jgi:hypothetical protein